MAVVPARALRRVLDPLLIACFVTWFYLPFLGEGVPAVDFASDVAVGEIDHSLRPSIFSVPAWNPTTMCGRPTLDFASPFAWLEWPIRRLEPITRLKALAIEYNVLAGLTMYALLLASAAGVDAALFGGLVYPVMTTHVTRTAYHGHIHVVATYAIVPLVFLALFRLRRRDHRRVVVLGLVLGLGLVRDAERTILLCTMIGIAIAGWLLAALVSALARRSLAPARRWIGLGVLFAAAFTVAVALDAFELVNSYLGSSGKAGFQESEQAQWMARWSLDNLYTVIDRNGFIASHLPGAIRIFPVSTSRYSGVSLLALVTVGALAPGAVRRQWRRFWFVLSLLALSLWLSAGRRPLWVGIAARWRELFASTAVPRSGKAAAAVVLLGLLAVAGAAVYRQLPRSRIRWLLALLLLGTGGALFLGTAPLPTVQRLVFFLSQLRNPDWFGVTLLSFAVCFPAALVLSAFARRYGRRAWYPLAFVALTVIALADFYPYRRYLSGSQRSRDAVASFREANLLIARDGVDFRVMPVERYSNLGDLGYIWHRKRLAWDFRSYSAPRRTGVFMNVLFDLVERGRVSELGLAANLAGIANVRYLVDNRDAGPQLAAGGGFVPEHVARRVSVFRNRSFRPFAQAYPEAHILFGASGATGVILAAALADLELGLVSVEELGGDLAVPGRQVFVDGSDREPVGAPPGAQVIGRGATPSVPRGRFPGQPPELSWSRLAPEQIRVVTRSLSAFFLLVSESFDDRWQATLDGAPLAVYPGGYAFLGAFIPSGEHTVDLRYQPPARFYVFGAVSLTTLASALTFLVWPRRRLRRLHTSDAVGEAE